MSDQVAESGQRLVGMAVPDLGFPATTGHVVDLAQEPLGDFVVFIYPRTGRPDRPEGDDWALIPGAKGCTAESCEFRDLAAEFSLIGLSIFGLSTQDTEYQREAAERLHLPYPLLSDPQMKLGRALGLETFSYDGVELYKRATLVVRDRVIVMAQLEITDAASHPRDLLAILSTPTGS
ncbi:peroxiredoxin [Agromyces larvae]|uniref:Peroxiredoxin n=1 Tax=Agromyces larvae TaxID=2929802 RepID=A0ABY4C0T0_9MICO|nr:peroxiredoxin [Agromyces larvae]UOE45096.1 peroxiredoxin [Agromyces larvae]